MIFLRWWLAPREDEDVEDEHVAPLLQWPRPPLHTAPVTMSPAPLWTSPESGRDRRESKSPRLYVHPLDTAILFAKPPPAARLPRVCDPSSIVIRVLIVDEDVPCIAFVGSRRG